MHQYISRRRRCWRVLKELDPEIDLSEGHQAELLLDLAGLDRGERIMIQASIGNVRVFSKVSEVLIVQHLRRHLKETKSNKKCVPSKGNSKGKNRSKGQKGKDKAKGNFRKTYRPTAHLADGEYHDY